MTGVLTAEERAYVDRMRKAVMGTNDAFGRLIAIIDRLTSGSTREVTREEIIATLRSFDGPRVGSPEALADPVRAQKWEDGRHDAAAIRADAILALLKRPTP